MSYVIAKYLRLSNEDTDTGDLGEGKKESNSISGQRDLLDSFIANTTDFDGWKIIEEVDDGFTGTNFNRGGVLRLIELAKEGKVHCIIVKEPYVKQKLKIS